MIPAEAVEAAAKIIVLTVVDRSWESLLPSRQEWHREQARAALEAAAPYMLAEAWEEGGRAAIEGEHAYGAEEKAKFTNPYKS